MEKRFISIILIFIICFSLLGDVFALNRDAYYEEMRVALDSMMKENISVNLNGEYLLDGQVQSNREFILKVNGDKIELNGELKQEINLQPSNVENTVTITWLDNNLQPIKDSNGNIIRRKYFGRFVFKVKNQKIFAINYVDIEKYVLGVIPYEMSESYPIEALKAQAVASRTYGLYNHINNSRQEYDVTDTTSHQVYRGYNENFVKCKEAVDKTKGQVLAYNDQFIAAFFHSSNGGYTEACENVWLQQFPYLVSKPDEYSVTNWPRGDKSFTLQQIEAGLKNRKYIPDTATLVKLDLDTIEFYESGRIKNIKAVCKDQNGNDLIVDLPKERLRVALALESNMYTVTYDDVNSIYKFSGRGYGHGIGLSQIGTRNRANAGQNYIDILNFYYPNTELVFLTSYINRVSISRPAVFVNDNILVNVDTEDGALLKYEVIKNNNVIYSEENKQEKQFIYKPTEDGDYIIRVSAKPQNSQNYVDLKEVKFKAVLPQVSRGGEEIAVNTFRIYGKDRIKTSVAVSQTGWDEAEYAVVARADDFPDALSSGPLAKKYDAPILLTNKNSLNQDVENELIRLGVKKVFIIGSEGAISKDVENKIKSLNISVERIGGRDRFETSIEIAKKIDSFNEIVITTGLNFPDALSIAPIAAIKQMPIILVPKDKMPSKIQEFLLDKNINKVYVIGGKEVVSDECVEIFADKLDRISGDNRYKTNAAILNRFKEDFSSSKLYIATGLNFPDALSGSGLIAKNNSPLVLVSGSIDDEIKNFVNNNFTNTTSKYILGGENVVSTSTYFDLFK